MYQYTISKEKTDEITEKTKNYSNLLDSFKQIDDKFKLKSDDSLNLEKMNFEKISDDQIKQKAENNLYDYKNESLESIENNYQTNKTKLNDQISTVKQEASKQKDETKQLYSSLKQEASNDALKRGLARSSIVINVLDAFDQNMIKEYNKINEEIASKVENLNSQISLLDEQRQSALNAFDISYAVKLSNKIDEITKELLEQEQKVIEFNNQIAQKEAEYKAKQQQDALDYAEYINKNGKEAIQQVKQDEKFELAKSYLNGLSKQEALDELNNNNLFTSELGPINFSKLKVLTLGRED